LFASESERGSSEVYGFSVTTCSSAVAVKSTTFGLPLFEEDGMGTPRGSMVKGLKTGGWKG